MQFGDSQLKRMVRILRTNVMVRVGGGWEDLNQFLNKHDPCRGLLKVVNACLRHVHFCPLACYILWTLELAVFSVTGCECGKV